MAFAVIDLMKICGRSPGLRPAGLLFRRTVRALPLERVVRLAGRRLCVPILGVVGAQLIGVSVRRSLTDIEAQTEVVDAMISRWQPDLVLSTLVDLTIEPEACGCRVEFPEDRLPSVCEHAAPSRRDLSRLDLPDPARSGRMPMYMELVRRFARRYALPNVVSSLAPFTLAAELVGPEAMARALIKDPDFAKQAMDYATAALVGYHRALMDAGADAIALADPTASILGKRQYAQFALPATREVVRRIDRPTLLHICGRASHLIELMCQTGVGGISVDAPVPLLGLAERVPKNMIILGNLSPATLLLQGSSDEVRSAAMEALRIMRRAPNFVLASGCDLAPRTPVENVRALIGVVRAW